MLTILNILLTTYPPIWGILFGILSASICGLMLQEIAGQLFWLILNFWHFWPIFEILHLFGLPCQDVTSHEKLSLILWLLKSNSAFSEAITCHEWQKRLKNFKKGPKMSKIQNQPKIMSCNFLRHQTTYGCTWYAKQNPPYRRICG